MKPTHDAGNPNRFPLDITLGRQREIKQSVRQPLQFRHVLPNALF